MLTVRNIKLEDIDSIVDVHTEAFSDFFLTTLGRNFLKIYYTSLIKNNDGIALCAHDELKVIVGFCAGTTNSEGFHKRLIMCNPVKFGVQIFILIIKKPKSIIRLFSNLEKQPLKQISGKIAELLSIGITKSAKGMGVGTALVEKFDIELKRRGSTIVTLTTDFYDNDKVISFYNKHGYDIQSEFIAYPDRRMIKMIKYL
jgi:ribosomal protein S18 acetylase RimI-like enzyme